MADSNRPPSPTPEEREKLDAEAKKKEQEEQSKLPYKWTQQIGDLDITAPIPGNIKGKDLDVKITKTSLKAGIKGQDVIIEVGCRPQLVSPNKSRANIRMAGHPPPPNPRRRILLDARDRQVRQRTSRPPRQSQQDGMVGSRRHLGTQNRHL